MLESLLNFKEINRRPYLAFFWSFAILSISIVMALKVGFVMNIGGSTVNLTGIFALAFALVSSSYIMANLIRREEMLEEKFIKKHYSKKFWGRHEKDILIFLYFFAGAVLAYAVWTMAPTSIVPADTFQVQLSSICSMRPEMSACGSGLTGAVTGGDQRFPVILANNLGVGVFSFIFAFIFGAGSAFIILWNAGILGIYIGMISKQLVDIPMQSIRFLPHGIPEIAGYICAGLAGTLISTAIIRKADREILTNVAWDSLKVLLLGIVLIIIGAVVESYL